MVGMFVFVVLISKDRISTYTDTKEINSNYNIINTYCEKNHDGNYLLAIDEIFSASSDVLGNESENLIYLEPWLTKSPMIISYLSRYRCEDFGELLLKEKTYYIAYKKYDINKFQQYMNSRFNGVEVKKVDSINSNYYVYKFIKK